MGAYPVFKGEPELFSFIHISENLSNEQYEKILHILFFPFILDSELRYCGFYHFCFSSTDNQILLPLSDDGQPGVGHLWYVPL